MGLLVDMRFYIPGMWWRIWLEVDVDFIYWHGPFCFPNLRLLSRYCTYIRPERPYYTIPPP